MPKKTELKNNLALVENLDERKCLILSTIIRLYLELGEPVGSRTISKKLDVSLSSATIRNEMSDLEEMGYIIKPHTSAGRIPSDKGYRFYVDNLIKTKENEIKAIKAEMSARVDRLEDMLKTVVKTISANTNYAAMIKGPSVNNTKLKYLQLSKLENDKVLVVVVAEGNIVKTSIVDVVKSLDAKEILDASLELNNLLSGRTISELKSDKIASQIKSIKNKDIVTIIKSIESAFSENDESESIFTYGSNNFFKYKEFTENQNASSLVETFEQKKDLAKLIDKSKDDENTTALNVYIGDESNVKSMKNCSVVTANCDFGNGLKGTIGVVGPKRMDYEKVLKTIKNTMMNLNKEFNVND